MQTLNCSLYPSQGRLVLIFQAMSTQMLCIYCCSYAIEQAKFPLSWGNIPQCLEGPH